MPWTADDVDKHKKGLSKKEKARWVAIANSVYDRCMSDGGKDSECAGSAIRQANGVVGHALQIHRIQADQLKVRTEMHQGRKHLVVPVIMMVEGVHNGSHGPLFHSAEELGRHIESWNGIPVTIFHPEVDGENVSANQPQVIDQNTVGRIYNAYMENDRLRAEAWIDEERIGSLSPQALSYIKEGRPLEVSVGIFSDEEATAGTWHDEEYVAIARNHRPDHLALLPGGTGACSWEDGCGVRTNQEGGAPTENKECTTPEEKKKKKQVDEDEEEEDLEDLKEMSGKSINDLPDSAFAYIEPGGSKDEDGKTIPRSLRHFPVHDATHARNALARASQSPFGKKAMSKIRAACKKFGIKISDNSELLMALEALDYVSLQVNANGYVERMEQLRAKLSAMDSEDVIHFMVEAYDDSFIYEKLERGVAGSELYKQDYEVNSDGSVNFSGRSVPVTRKVEYVTNNASDTHGGITTMAEAKKPCCPGKVEILIQSKQSPFEEIDREWLLSLEEGQIDRLIQTDALLVAAAKKAEEQPPPITQEQATEALKDLLADPEKFIKLLSEDLQEQMKSGLQLHREKRQKLIQALVATNSSKFSEEKLKNRTMESLEELVSLIPEKSDYSVNAAGGDLSTNDEEILAPFGVEFK